MAPKKNSLTLRITGPDGVLSESRSEQDSVVLGSGAGAAVQIRDPKVSNLHCMLKVEQTGIVNVIDLGSESGTRLGEALIKTPTALSSGDVLKIGSSSVKVLFGEGESTVAVTITPQMARELDQRAVSAQSSVSVSPPPQLPPSIAPVAPPLPASPHPHLKASMNPTSQGKNKGHAPARGLAGTGRNAAILFNDPLPPEATPSEDSKVLQVALLWGDTLINVQHFADGVPVTIGENKGNKFTVYSPGVGGNFTLAQSASGKILVNIPSDAGLVFSSGSSQKSKEQLRGEGRLRAAEGANRADAVELGLHDRVQVSLETVAFIVRYVRPSAAITVSRMEDADFGFFKIASICIMAFLAMVAAMILSPPIEGGTADDIFANPARYTRLLVKPEKKIDIQKFKEKSGVEEGAKAKDKEGKFGKQDEKKKEADPSKKGAPVVDANKREEDRKKVASAGLLGAMKNMGGGASNVFGPGGLGTGINNALGGLKGGAGIGDAQGVGGLGSRGAGPGGGGSGLGLGGLGTKGGGRGAGGAGSIDLGGRGRDVTRVIPGKTTVVGGLSKDVIASVIKRHQNEIKYCYESELSKQPDLAGKVAVMFMIDPAGAVAEANVSESTLNNNTAENCMLARIRRWKFPEPTGGGVVNVTFPWVFQPAGSGE